MQRLNLIYHNVPGMGYGRMGIYTKSALERIGVEDYGSVLGEEGHPDPTRRRAPVALWLSTPPHMDGRWEGQCQAIFTMWEYTEMPAGFRENIRKADKVLVPSRQNLELFRRFHPNVEYVPLGIDQEKWKPTKRQEPGREFRFLTAGTGKRKNCELVDKAFRRVFNGYKVPVGRPIPKLIVRAKSAMPGQNVQIITCPLSDEDELALYENAHCFVSASRGEGWGLMPNQALAQGLPTIVPDAHGHEAFAQFGIPIEATPVPCGHATFWGDSGEWWEPNLDQMCEAMWEVYSDYEPVAEEAYVNAYRVGALYNWDNTALLIQHFLGDEMAGPDAPMDSPWVDTKPLQYRIVTNRDSVWTINGQAHHFKKGEEKWGSFDLKCLLGRSGHLDESCIDPHEMGREEADLALDANAKTLCPTCKQPLPLIR